MPFNLKIYSENFEDYTGRPAEFKWTDPSITIDINDYPTMFREKNGKTLSIKSIKIEDLEIKSKVYNIRSYSNANGADSNLFFSKTSRSQSTKMEAFSPYFEIQSGDSISFDVRNLDVDSDWTLLGRSYKANIKIELNSENGTDEQVLATYSGIERSFIPFKANATVAGKYRLKITAYTEAYEFGDISNVTDADADISIDNVIISRGSIIELNKESVSEGDDFSVIIRPPLPSVGEQLYYKITGADKYDILSNQISGKTLVGSNNTALINISTVKDLKTEGKEEWKLLLYEDPEFTKSIAEPIVINILDISKTPSFEQGYSYKSEGSEIQLTITSSEYDVGSKLYYALSGNGITESDFDSKQLTGEVTLQKDSVKLLIKLANDMLTEGDENVELIFYSDADRSIEITHPYYSEYSTKTFTIYDTSKSPPSFKIATSASRINEGDELKTTISAKDFEGRIYWSISGKGISEKDFAQGSLRNDRYVTESNNYVISHTLKSDQVTEGEEQIEIKLFSDYNRTVQLGATSVVIVNDTSLPRETILPEQIQDGFLDLDNGEDPILMWKGKFLNIDDVKDWNKSISGEIRNADTGQIIDLSLYNIHVAQDGSFEFAIDLENASSGDWDFSEFYVAGNGYWNPELYIKVYPTEKNKYNEEKEVGLSELANNLELGIPKFKVQNKNADMVAPTIKSYKLPSQLNDGILDIDAGESTQLVYEFSIEDAYLDANKNYEFSDLSFTFENLNDKSYIYSTYDKKSETAKLTLDAANIRPGAYKAIKFYIADAERNSYNYHLSEYTISDEYYNEKKLSREAFSSAAGIDPEDGKFNFIIKNSNYIASELIRGDLNTKVQFLSLPSQLSDGIIDLTGGESPKLDLIIKFPDLIGKDLNTTAEKAWLSFQVENKETMVSKTLFVFSPSRFDLSNFNSLSGELKLSTDVSWFSAGNYFLRFSIIADADGDLVQYFRSGVVAEDIRKDQDAFKFKTGIDPSSNYFEFNVKNNKADTEPPAIKIEQFVYDSKSINSTTEFISIIGSITDLNKDGTEGSGVESLRLSYINKHDDEIENFDFLITESDLDSSGKFSKKFPVSSLSSGTWLPSFISWQDKAENYKFYNFRDEYSNRQLRINEKIKFNATTGVDLDQFIPFFIPFKKENQGSAKFILSGPTFVGQILLIAKTDDDPEGDGLFSYQWQSSTDGNTWSELVTTDTVDNNNSYFLTKADANKTIRAVVSYLDTEGNNEVVNSVASEYIAIVPATYSVTTSAAKINEASTLTATVATTNVASGTRLYYSLSGVGITSNDISVGYITGVVKVDNEGTAKFSVQFLNDLATEGTETLEIKFFKDNVFSEQLGSTAYVVIEDSSTKLNIAPTGSPTVRGNFKPGSILTISDSTIKDSDNFTGYKPEFEYNWQTSIDGINWTKLNTADALDGNNTYLLTAAEENKQIRVITSYTDGYGTLESISSESSSELAAHQISDELIGSSLDFNGDSKVDSFDSILMMRYMMGTFPGDSIKRDLPGKFELTAMQRKLTNAFSDISFDGSLRLDIDGDKRISAFRDGMMITQHIHKQGISDTPWAPPGFNPPAGFFAQMQQHLKDLIEF